MKTIYNPLTRSYQLVNETNTVVNQTVTNILQELVDQASDDVLSNLNYYLGYEKRIYYDSLIAGPNTYPATEANVAGPNYRYAAFIMNNFSQFTKCRWEMINLTNPQRIDGITFSSLAELATFKNNNVPHGTSTFTDVVIFRPYDVVENSLPVIDKLYGMNKLYSAFRGAGNYKSGDSHAGNIKSTFYDGAQLLWNVFNEYYPTLASLVTVDSFRTGNSKFAVWLGSDSRKMYGLPKEGARIECIPISDRYKANENWEGFYKINSNQYFFLNDPRIVVWEGGSSSGGTIDIYNPVNFNERGQSTYQIVSRPNASAMMFYLALDNGPAGDRDFGIYGKPIGIDTVYINHVDTTKYDIEAVYVNRDTQKCVFRKIDPADITRSNMRTDQLAIPKSYWTVTNNFSLNYKAAGWFRPHDVYFRIRDKSTNKISKSSRAKIRALYGHGLAPVKWMVI